MAVASLVLGIMSLALPWKAVCLIAGATGLCLGIMSRMRGASGGLAVTGIVLSSIGLGLSIMALGSGLVFRSWTPPPRGVTV